METAALSETATALLLRRRAGEHVPVTDDSRHPYRELAEAGLMTPLHSFANGDEGAYRLTKAGVDFGCAKGGVVAG